MIEIFSGGFCAQRLVQQSPAPEPPKGSSYGFPQCRSAATKTGVETVIEAISAKWLRQK
jgi:hypothetical protein